MDTFHVIFYSDTIRRCILATKDNTILSVYVIVRACLQFIKWTARWFVCILVKKEQRHFHFVFTTYFGVTRQLTTHLTLTENVIMVGDITKNGCCYKLIGFIFTSWRVSKYGVISGPYLDTFYVVVLFSNKRWRFGKFSFILSKASDRPKFQCIFSFQSLFPRITGLNITSSIKCRNVMKRAFKLNLNSSW